MPVKKETIPMYSDPEGQNVIGHQSRIVDFPNDSEANPQVQRAMKAMAKNLETANEAEPTEAEKLAKAIEWLSADRRREFIDAAAKCCSEEGRPGYPAKSIAARIAFLKTTLNCLETAYHAKIYDLPTELRELIYGEGV